MSMASKIEDMELEAETLRSLALAVFHAIYGCHTHHSEFECACNLVVTLSHDHAEHLKVLKQEAYEEMRAQRKSEKSHSDKEKEL